MKYSYLKNDNYSDEDFYSTNFADLKIGRAKFFERIFY